MSYASALLNGVSSDEKPVPTPKAQAPTQPQQTEAPQSNPAVKAPQESKPEQVAPQPKAGVVLEGNDGGFLGQLLKDEKEHSAKHQKKADRILSKVLFSANPASISALGRTCHYFLNQILKNKNRELGPLLYARQKIASPTITFRVDFIEGKDDSDTKNVTLSYFAENQRRQNALCKYWAKVVLQAQEKRAKAGIDPKDIMHDKGLPVKLHGGLHFYGNKHGPLLAQRDLTRTHSWLDSCIKLLQGKMRQEVPYLDGGKAILTRYGLGGTKIKVETVLPAGHAKTEDEKKLAELVPTIHRYEFAEFCLNLRSAAKAFVPLVGTCVVSMKQGIRNVPQEETAAYLEREKILVDLLKHQTLHNDVKTIKKYLVQGVIPGSELPAIFRKRREEKLRLKQQQALEYDNIYKFLQNNVPEDFENAKSQAKAINSELVLQKEKEKADRKQAYEDRKAGLKKPAGAEVGGSGQEAPLSSSPGSFSSEPSWSSKKPKERLKKKVVKEKDEDGFMREAVYIVQNDGGLKSAPPKQVQVETPVAKKQGPVVSEAFDNNLFHAALLESSYVSIKEDQHQKSVHKTQSRLDAEEKKQLQKAQKARENQKKKAQKQQQQQLQQQKEKTAAAAKSAKSKAATTPTPAPAAKPAAKVQKQPQNQPKKNQEKTKTLQRSKGQQQKQQEQDTSIPPVAAALAVACIVAFGYVFMFAG